MSAPCLEEDLLGSGGSYPVQRAILRHLNYNDVQSLVQTCRSLQDSDILILCKDYTDFSFSLLSKYCMFPYHATRVIKSLTSPGTAPTLEEQLPGHPNQDNCLTFSTSSRSTNRYEGCLLKPRLIIHGKDAGPLQDVAQETFEDDKGALNPCLHQAEDGHEIWPCQHHVGERPFWVCKHHTYLDREQNADVTQMAPYLSGPQTECLCDHCYDYVFHFYDGALCDCAEVLHNISHSWSCVECVDNEIARWIARSARPPHVQFLQTRDDEPPFPWQCVRCTYKNPEGIRDEDNVPGNIFRSKVWIAAAAWSSKDWQRAAHIDNQTQPMSWCDRCHRPIQLPDNRPDDGTLGCTCVRCELRWRMEGLDIIEAHYKRLEESELPGQDDKEVLTEEPTETGWH